jgi:hypothetical protein
MQTNVRSDHTANEWDPYAMARTAKPKSSTVEHPPAPELPTNRTVNGLFAAACEAGRHVHAHEAQHVEKHTDIVLKALQCVMELVELGKEQPAELQSLLDYHKTRKDLDTIGRIVKLVFPKETPQLRNCYAEALRHAERHGQTANQTPDFLRNKGIKKAATVEVKRRRGEELAATDTTPMMWMIPVRSIAASPAAVATLTGRPELPGRMVKVGKMGMSVFVPRKGSVVSSETTPAPSPEASTPSA